MSSAFNYILTMTLSLFERHPPNRHVPSRVSPTAQSPDRPPHPFQPHRAFHPLMPQVIHVLIKYIQHIDSIIKNNPHPQSFPSAATMRCGVLLPPFPHTTSPIPPIPLGPHILLYQSNRTIALHHFLCGNWDLCRQFAGIHSPLIIEQGKHIGTGSAHRCLILFLRHTVRLTR